MRRFNSQFLSNHKKISIIGYFFLNFRKFIFFIFVKNFYYYINFNFLIIYSFIKTIVLVQNPFFSTINCSFVIIFIFNYHFIIIQNFFVLQILYSFTNREFIVQSLHFSKISVYLTFFKYFIAFIIIKTHF